MENAGWKTKQNGEYSLNFAISPDRNFFRPYIYYHILWRNATVFSPKKKLICLYLSPSALFLPSPVKSLSFSAMILSIFER